MSAQGIEAQDRFLGKGVPTSEFDGDDGLPLPGIAEALAAWAQGGSDKYATTNALRPSRLFVPVTAVLDSAETNESGHEVEKDSHIASISLQLPDGRKAMLAFTSIPAMLAWSTTVRPVPATARNVAAAALVEAADVLAVDVGSERPLPIETAGLLALAEDRDWIVPVADPVVISELTAILTPIGEEHACQFEVSAPTDPSYDVDLTVVGPDASEAAKQVVVLLAQSALLRQRMTGGVRLSVRT